MLSKFQISVSKSQTSKLIYRSKISKLTSLISHESDIETKKFEFSALDLV
jgi:hypothetical protein